MRINRSDDSIYKEGFPPCDSYIEFLMYCEKKAKIIALSYD